MVPLDFLSVTLGALTALVVALPAAFAFRRQWIQQRTSELQQLVETRGMTIEDLVRKNALLEIRVDKLEGMMAALEGLKAQEIARSVVVMLNEEGFVHDEG